jgi:hypothetical protein
MSRRQTGRWNEERGLLLAGLLGLGGGLFFACVEDGGTDATATREMRGPAPAGTSVTPGEAVPCTSDPGTADHTAAVADAANELLALLPPGQQAAIQIEKTLANAQRWSNVPGPYGRNGVKLADMSAEARAAALALVDFAAGPTGRALFDGIREAEEVLISDGHASPTGYGRGLYSFSIHGTPGAGSAWMLQICGHHLAYNFMYDGRCTSATPLFDGVEPATWTDANGRHAPLEPQLTALVALLSSVRSLPGAKLAESHGDLINGPEYATNGDTKYPSGLTYPAGTTGRGVAVATLSADQKALVKTAIEAWVNNVSEPVSSALLAAYESTEALAQTYVAYSGSPDLTTPGSYARIDGPRVWIELSVRSGVVFRDRGHYHTLWRDKAADYGAELASP